jgi:hypothetical protein
MVEVIAGPFQPDDVETRERMRVKTNPSLSPIQYSKLEHQDIITFDPEYVEEILRPSVSRVWPANTYFDDETAYIYNSKAWLTTLGPAFPGIERSYEADMVAVGAATHLQDPWVGDLITDLTTAINAQVLAGTHPGVPAGLMSWSVEFLTDDDLYPGTVSGRSVEIASAEREGHEYDRSGVEIIPEFGESVTSFDPIYGLALPRSASNPAFDDPDGGDYAEDFGPIAYTTTGDTTGTETPPDAWSAPTLEDRATAVAPEGNVFDGAVLLGTVNVDGGPATWTVDDAWWEANKWTITRFGSDVNYGVPVMLTPEWLVFNSLYHIAELNQPYGYERHTTGRASATLYMNATWTPPPYRIVYDVERITIPPRRIRQRGDGLTGGARGIKTGARTRQAGNRTIGGIL